LTKQTLSRMLRNPIYAGWIVSGDVKVKGLHQPIVSQELFDDVQDALAGKTARPVAHKMVNAEFALTGFVMCSACGKKLTAGFAKGRREKYPRYWCWNPKCVSKVSAGRDELALAFLRILGTMKPTQEFIARLPEIAKTYWARRLERITADRRMLSNRQANVRTLNQKILVQKVSGELSAEDFATLKAHVAEQTAEIETQQHALDTETATTEALLEETQHNFVDLVTAWREGNTQRRQELRFSLFPEGLYFSRESMFFEPRNTWLWQAWQEWFQSLEKVDLSVENVYCDM
jgi:site-specific DNA recombinase